MARDNEGINPNFPDEPIKVPRIRRPGRYFAEPLDTYKYRLGNWPIYVAPAGPQVAFTKRASLGLAALGGYIGYLATTMSSVSTLAAVLGVIPLLMPIPLFQYFSKPYVTRIFRLYDRIEPVQHKRQGEDGLEYIEEEPQPDTYETITGDETLVVEQIGTFGRSVHATRIKLNDVRLVKERMGWANWVYKDEKTGEELPLYVADNVGGIKMDRIWGVVEKNSGVDNGRGFLNQP